MQAGKKTYQLFLFALWMMLGPASAMAQLNYEFTEGKFFIKGRISDLKTEQGVPNANIWITNQKKGVVADEDGRFTMYVYPTDTLRFSSLGYINKTIPVSAIPERDRYTIAIQLVPDIYSLHTVTIYPFHDRDGFIQAFLKGTGNYKSFYVPGYEPSKYPHREKSKFYNPISSIYDRIKRNKSAADPDFKPNE
jgi:hypothetical protein